MKEKLNILLLGRDDSSGLADAIVIASVDTEQNILTLIQIPRDTYINLGENSYKKINGAAKILGGDRELCEKISQSMGIDVDGYVSFDADLVREIVDVIGGVELCVPIDMDYDDPYQDLSIHLKKGRQILNGEQAISFVRYRKGYLRADIGRIDAQKIFLSAFSATLIEKIDAKDILPLLKIAMRYIKTDLPTSRIISLGRAMYKTPIENIRFATMPGEEVQSERSGAWFYILSRSGCEEILQSIGADGAFDGGQIYSDKSRYEFEEIYNREIKARIYNAGKIDGEGIEIIPK